MSRFCVSLASVLIFGAFSVRAAEPVAALGCVPKQAGLALVVEHPRRLAEAIVGLKALQDARALTAVREVLDGTAVRRSVQLLAYVERETGAAWPELLDQAAGGGVVLALTYDAAGPDAALLVIQGTDEAKSAKLFELFVRVAEEDQARKGDAQAIRRSRHRDADVVTLNAELLLARREKTVLLANRSEALKAALDLSASGKRGGSLLAQPTLAAARKALPGDPLAWFWLDFAAIKKTKQSQDFFEATRKDLFQTLLFGSTADCLRRSDFVAGGLYAEKQGLRFSLRLPAGREGFPAEFALHVPPANTPGSLPLLEPPGVLYSQSFHLDLATLWAERDKLINPEVRKQIEKGEKDVSKILPGVKLGELLSMWGAHHRFVIVNMDQPPYKADPGQKLPGFGYVASMRDPQFGKTVEGLLRGGGFLASLSQGVKLVEGEADGVKIVGYRFPEDRTLPGDEERIRYNFEPSFAIVDGQFVLASTMELAKKLVVEVRRQAEGPGSEQVWRARAYAAGGAEALRKAPDAAVTDAVLRQAIGLAEARQQVEQVIAYLQTLGTFGIELDVTASEYKFDVVWRLPK